MTDESVSALPRTCFQDMGELSCGALLMAWHVEDQQGHRSVNLGGPGVANIDLVLGQGRITGQAILKDVGRAALQRMYSIIEQQ